jgi:hypothetical protein
MVMIAIPQGCRRGTAGGSPFLLPLKGKRGERTSTPILHEAASAADGRAAKVPLGSRHRLIRGCVAQHRFGVGVGRHPANCLFAGGGGQLRANARLDVPFAVAGKAAATPPGPYAAARLDNSKELGLGLSIAWPGGYSG